MKTFLTLTLFGLFFFNLQAKFDHSHQLFQKVLDNYLVEVDGQTLIDYGALKKNSSTLNQYVEVITQLPKKQYESFDEKQKLSFLINSYNALTLQLIIKHFPVESIKDIGSFFSSPWKKDFFHFLGRPSNLDHIEHGIIRKQFKEPRIHFAVNCASISCPNLHLEVFTALKLDGQLEELTIKFLGHQKKNYYDEKKNTLFVSKIFDWYGGDFGDYKKYLLVYFPQIKKEQIGSLKIKFLSYDWGLNNFSKPKVKNN